MRLRFVNLFYSLMLLRCICVCNDVSYIESLSW